MSRAFIVCLLVFNALQSRGQWLHIAGTLQDSLSIPVAYAAIGIPGTTHGTVSNQDGAYTLIVPETMAKEAMVISCLGYLPVTTTVAQLASSPRVLMKISSLTLQEVTIKPGKKVRKVLGTERFKSGMTTNLSIGKFPSQNLGAALGKKFYPGSGVFYPDTFRFYLAYTTYDTTILRVMVYDVKGGKPGSPLMPADCVVSLIGKQKGWITVDLTPYKLALDKNFIVAVEWIGASAKGTHLGIPIKMPWPGSEHFYRYGSQNNWKRFFSMTTPMNLSGIQVR